MIDKITQLQYANLRKEHDRLIDHVLGSDYYNMGMDVYGCDTETVNDLIQVYDNLKSLNKVKTICMILLIVVITVLSIVIII